MDDLAPASEPAAVRRLRRAWAEGRGSEAIGESLAGGVLGDPDLLAEVLAADAEERWERGLEATLETYIPRVPELVTRPEACRALLLCELARRDDRDTPVAVEQLKSRLPELSDAIELVASFLSSFGSELGPHEAEPGRRALDAGQRLGEYTLRERIGRGSFGEVWRAWDAKLERNVALKLLASAGNGELDHVLDEARAAAGLEHDNIVRVHAAGRFDDHDLLYIDTQLVGEPAPTGDDPDAVRVGRSLEEETRRGRIERRRATEMMERVCRAVAAAHARGVTHGDIKPGNVLLSPSGRPMVADFGLAVLAPPSPGGASPTHSVCIETGRGRITGTPAYMSPEQASAEPATPLSDIYSLGTTLMALLLGRAPFEPRPGSTRASLDVIEQVRETGPDLSQVRSIDPTLAAVCARATARDPRERYVSADQMADDLRACLDHRPTRALPLSAPRRLVLLARRHAVAVAVAATVLTALGGVSAWYVASITRAESRATAEAANFQATLAFLTDMLESTKPAEALGREITLREKLDDASAQLRESPPDSTPVAYSLNRVLGGTYYALSLFDDAEWHTTEALRLARELHDGDHAETAEALQRLGSLRTMQGRRQEAADLLDAALAMTERLEGRDAASYARLEHERAGLMLAAGKFAEAGPMLEHAYAVLQRELPPGDEGLILVANALGGLFSGLGRNDDAVRVIGEASAGMTEAFGARHPQTMVTRTNHGIALARAGRLEEAEAELRAVLADADEVLGPGHVIRMNALNSYARILDRTGRLEEAEAVYRDALAQADTSLDDGSKQSLELRNNLGMNLLMQERAGEALPVLRRSAELHEQAYGADTVFTALAFGSVGKALVAIGGDANLREADRLLSRALESIRTELPAQHPAVLSTLRSLESIYGPDGLDRPDRLAEIRRALEAPGG